MGVAEPEPQALNGRRLMVIVGIDEYREWPSLRNAVGDASGFARVMREKLGFSTAGQLLNERASKRDILHLIDDEVRRQLQPDDELVVFFAGHGTSRVDKIGGKEVETGFLVPFDARAPGQEEQWSDYIQVDQFLDMIGKLPARHILVLLDSCYSGFALGRAVDTFRGEFRYQRDLGQRVSRKVISSARRNQLASDKGSLSGHSLFTGALIDGIETGSADLDGDGVVTSSELGLYLQQQVGRATASAQTPDYGSFYLDDRGEILLPVSEKTVVKAAAQPQARDRGARLAVAFLGFNNLSQKPEHDWISTALSEMLRTEVGAGDIVRTIPGETVSRVKHELAVPKAGSLSPETLSAIYQSLGSDYVVTGSYLDIDGKLRIDLRLQNALTGDTISDLSETGTEADFFGVVGRLGTALRRKCGTSEAPAEQVTAVRAKEPGNAQAMRLYSQALDKLGTFEYVGARNLLQQAIVSDPNNAALHAVLARTLSELGADSEAAVEGRRAHDLAAGLERRDALLIDAEYRQAGKQWDQAIELYKSLWTFFPDDLEYALKLASAQLSAGRAQDALGTLVSARKLGRPQRDDPRIDLVEAQAANAVSDYRRQSLVAKTAFDKANRRGSHLLAADALLQQCQAHRRLGEFEIARKFGQSAADQFSLSHDLKREAKSVTCVANAFADEGNNPAARAQFENALKLAREAGAQADVAGALLNLGNILLTDQKLDESTNSYQQALAVAAEVGDQVDKLAAEINLGANLMMKGDFTGARKMLEDSIATARAIGDRTKVVEAQLNLAAISYAEGDLASAQNELDQTLGACHDLGLKGQTAASLRAMGDVYLARGDLAKAEKSYREALNVRTEIGDTSGIADSHAALAEVALENNRLQEAETMADRAAREFEATGDRDLQTVALNVLVRTLLAAGKLDLAARQLERARELDSRDLVVVTGLEITSSRLRARTGNVGDAVTEQDQIISDARKRHLGFIQLTARLARAESQAISGDRAAKSSCDSLASDAAQAGFGLIARRAAETCRTHGL